MLSRSEPFADSTVGHRRVTTRSGRWVAQAQTPRVTLNARHERWCKGAQRPLRRTLDGMARLSETILTTSACYRGQRVGVAGQKPAAFNTLVAEIRPPAGEVGGGGQIDPPAGVEIAFSHGRPEAIAQIGGCR